MQGIARLPVTYCRLAGSVGIYLLLSAGAFAEGTVSSRECLQMGGTVECTLPIKAASSWTFYVDPYWLGAVYRISPSPTLAGLVQNISQYYAPQVGGDANNYQFQYCSAAPSGAQCGGEVPGFYEFTMECSASFTVTPYEWSSGGLSQICGAARTDTWRVGGSSTSVDACPAGSSKTSGSAYFNRTLYPFLCAKDVVPPPPPPPPPAQEDGPDTGSPDAADVTPPKPEAPEVSSSTPEPEVQPDEGGGANSSGSTDCTGASATEGDPINTSNGSKFVTITDYAPAGGSLLRLIRYYDSRMVAGGSFGPNWRQHYDRSLESVSSTTVKLRRADGKVFTYTLANGQWTTVGSVNLQLQPIGDRQGWKVTTPSDGVELYDAQGRLIQTTQRGGRSLSMTYNGAGKLYSVSDNLGGQLTFEYDAQGRVAVVTDPAGQPYRYTYDAAGNLSTRLTPDGRTIKYAYENPSFPHALTAVVDGNNIQTDTTFYDLKGRAYSNERNAGIDKVSIAYGDTNGSGATATDTNNVARSYTFQLIQGVFKATGLTRNCPTCGTATRSFMRDSNGNITSRTDFNGIRTTYQYDASRNLETSRTEAAGTPVERVISTEWHPALHVPVKIAEPGRVTTMVYDDNGNMTELSVTDVASGERRTWHYSYGAFGLLTSRTLPSGESIAYAYSDNGLLSSTTTATGLVTQYLDYDPNGHVGKIVYPGGNTVAFTYDGVGRVLTRAETVISASDGMGWWQQVMEWLRKLLGLSTSPPQAQGESGTAVTQYHYDNAGLLTDLTLPDGESLHYEYDAAYRLILARNSLGNTIRIVRDPYGNPLETQVSDASGTLALTLRRTYDELGRVTAVLGNNGQQLNARYDAEGYLLEQIDALGHRTTRSRDALYRTTAVTSADSQVTQFEFDPLDRLTRVTNAQGNSTVYGRNAFDNITSEISPDRGSLLREFDGGRLTRETDARGITHQFTYDADGRVLSRTSPNSHVSFRYDEGEFGKGRLTNVNDDSGSTTYRYNSQGRVVEKTSVIQQGPTLKISYGYTLGGKLKEIATPGKHLIQYGYDAQGRISTISVDGQSLLGQIRFGATGVSGWTWANGEQRDERYDQDGRIVQITSGNALARTYGYDTANRLVRLLDAKAGVMDRYGYDALGRLISQQGASFGVNYRYDALGNRTQKQTTQGNSITVTNYSYASTSNHLLSETTGNKVKSYSYLPSGQLSGDGETTYRYNDDGRLTEVAGQRPLRNDYNAMGQRVRKSGQSVIVFAYDEAGHLAGEYTPGGVLIREYVWLGNRLVGMLSQQEKGVLFVHADHLGTPRAVSSGATVLWRWEGEAFGNNEPNEQVAGPSRKFTMPLRFPGQYADGETGSFYNYFRDYYPAIGRYTESDPIGLSGGLNTYAYAEGRPGSTVDQYGLTPMSDFMDNAANAGMTPGVQIRQNENGRTDVVLYLMDGNGNVTHSGVFDPSTGEQSGTISDDFILDPESPSYHDWLKSNCPDSAPSR